MTGTCSLLSDYRRDLEKDIVSETSGHFKRLLVSMCQGAREEHAAVDMAKAKAEAQQLYQAGEKKWGTDESKFNQIIAVRSFPQLRATFDEYVKVGELSCDLVLYCVWGEEVHVFMYGTLAVDLST